MATALPNPFIEIHRTRFTLDEQRFMTEIEHPIFVDYPARDYLTAAELIPLVELLNRYA